MEKWVLLSRGHGGNSSFHHCQRLKHRFQHLALRKEVRIFFHSSRRRPWLVLTINRSGNQGNNLRHVLVPVHPSMPVMMGLDLEGAGLTGLDRTWIVCMYLRQ